MTAAMLKEKVKDTQYINTTAGNITFTPLNMTLVVL